MEKLDEGLNMLRGNSAGNGNIMLRRFAQRHWTLEYQKQQL
jgi:hypothetical protein